MSNKYLPEGYITDTAQNTEYTSSLSGLEYAMKNNIICEARVTLCDSEKNLYVDLNGLKGVIQRSEAAYSPDGAALKDIAVITKVGKPVCFKVLSVPESSDGYVILSRRLAQEECYLNYVKHLYSGDIINARVTHTEGFGAFCDIGCGLVSLLSVDCISVSRINHPSDRFYSGQKIKCIVKYNDSETKRITLSTKELFGTWEQNARRFNPGETAAGIIRSVESYGIFVELAPNLAGLAEWCPCVTPGQSAAVYIKSIIPEKMKIKLVIVDTGDTSAKIKAPEYFISDSHISRWDYSPECCPKKIFTDFEAV